MLDLPVIKVDAPQLILDGLDLDQRLAALRQKLRLAGAFVVKRDVATEAPPRVQVTKPGL